MCHRAAVWKLCVHKTQGRGHLSQLHFIDCPVLGMTLGSLDLKRSPKPVRRAAKEGLLSGCAGNQSLMLW